ncbi:ATP-binding region ATPase domain protein [Desulfurispirillum indicum S5]|uniref:histidine kinase n=1 Tax=Desulfurispirillum indicum (strain ATCC BAA-1389 / DSM 22839 / S5) TaxID=653733 RepID=E6W7C1_DESIS|nr:ATP-binding protein [Desulfurispirillum indicum]ADU66288.1 ATP-binding region ATPase domain protein [Desulfurispirillum indicum S5]
MQKRKSLARHIFLPVLALSALSIIAVNVLMYASLFSAVEKNLRDGMASVINSHLHVHFDYYIDQIVTDMRFTTQRFFLDEQWRDSDAFSEHIEQLKDRYHAAEVFMYCPASGTSYVNPQGLSRSSWELSSPARPVFSIHSDQRKARLSVPAENGSNDCGFMGMDFSLETVLEQVDFDVLGQVSRYVIFDQGQAWFSGEHSDNRRWLELVRQKRVAGTHFFPSLNGRDKAFTFITPLQDIGWYLAVEIPRSQFTRNYYLTFQWISLIIVLFIVLLVIAILAILYLRVKKPLSSIIEALRSYDPAAPFDFKALSSFSREYHDIAFAFSFMDGRLKNTYAQLQRSQQHLQQVNQSLEQLVASKTWELEEKIREIQVINQDLSQAKEDAIQSLNIRSEFMANVSHELKTPLNSIINFTDQILEDFDEMLSDDELQAEYHGYLERVLSNARHLLALINDLLLYSKADSSKLDYEMEWQNVVPLLGDCLEDFHPMAQQKHIQLHLEVPKKLYVCIDELRFLQVLQNLISNAIKFTDSGSVNVRASDETGRVVVEVADTGRGIPTEKMPVIFDPFSQLNRFDQGTGLGLGLVKKMCEGMDIRIEIDSEVGRGTTFRLLFDRTPPAQ